MKTDNVERGFERERERGSPRVLGLPGCSAARSWVDFGVGFSLSYLLLVFTVLLFSFGGYGFLGFVVGCVGIEL